MGKKVALLTVHGMGEMPRDYNAQLKGALRERLGKLYDDLHVGAVYYQGILQPNETRVWNAVEERLAGKWDWARRLWWNDLRRFLLFGFGDAAGLENGKECDASVYSRAQVIIARELLRACRAMAGDGPLVILAQSLGCHVTSCFFWDAQQDAEGAKVKIGIWQDLRRFEGQITEGGPLTTKEKCFLQGSSFNTFFTTGCNIPIFVAAHAMKEIRPICPNAHFRWHNYFDQDDVLGWPLASLSEAYARVVQDHPINAGAGIIGWLIKSWNPLSHTQYWGDNNVLDQLELRIRELLEVGAG